MTLAPKDIDAYISHQPEKVRELLETLRETIKSVAPDAEEVISYNMPAFKYHGMLVYFAAHKNHIGFYPIPSGIETFKKELSIYKGTKSSVHFPFDKKLPITLIKKMVKFRMKENLEKEINSGKSQIIIGV